MGFWSKKKNVRSLLRYCPDDDQEPYEPVDPDEDSDAAAPSEPDEPTATVKCPACGKEVFAEALRCPHCKAYVTPVDDARRRPLWAMVAVFICLVIMLGWVVGPAIQLLSWFFGH